jgi:uncharacterized protein YbaR (Trm112 family)
VAESTDGGRVTVLACPQCTGPLYEVEQDGALRFCCADGHAFEPNELCPGIADDLEGLLPELVEVLTD